MLPCLKDFHLTQSSNTRVSVGRLLQIADLKSLSSLTAYRGKSAYSFRVLQTCSWPKSAPSRAGSVFRSTLLLELRTAGAAVYQGSIRVCQLLHNVRSKHMQAELLVYSNWMPSLRALTSSTEYGVLPSSDQLRKLKMMVWKHEGLLLWD